MYSARYANTARLSLDVRPMAAAPTNSTSAPDAWTRARDRFTEDLTEDERYIYFQATPETIFYDASATEKINSTTSKSRNFLRRLQPVVDAMEQYGKALDVYANTYPLVMSPLWGSLRVVLHLAREFGQHFERIADMFVQIGDLLPRLRIYERLFRDHERVVQVLSVIYCDILRFCADAKTALRHAKRSTLSRTWKTFDREFGSTIEKFQQHQKLVEKEVKTSNMIESANSRESLRSDQLELARARQESERLQIFASMSTVDYEQRFEELGALRHKGTGTWLVEHPTYVKWRSLSSSSGLCCRGIPGSGKSVLAALVVSDLRSYTPQQGCDPIYYFCDYAEPLTLELSTIYRTMLQQLFLKGLLDECIINAIIETYTKHSHGPNDRRLAMLLQQAIELSKGVHIVVDGLDECPEVVQRSLIDTLIHLLSKDQPLVKVLVTSREEERPLKYLDSFKQIQVSESVAADDMKTYISDMVRSSLERGDMIIREAKLQHEIVAKLIAQAHGMFLWVHYQIQDLCEAASDAAIRDIITHLPQGLHETYKRILVKISKSVNKVIALRALRWIACARRPLKIKELQEAVAFDETDTRWNDDKIPDADRLVRSCYGMIVRDNNLSVRFAHHTIRQFLMPFGLSEREIYPTEFESGLNRDLQSCFFSEGEGAHLITQMCAIYLCFSDFDSALVQNEATRSNVINEVFRGGGPMAIPATLGFHKSLFNIPHRLFGGKSRLKVPDIDFSKYVHAGVVNQQPAPDLHSKYALLSYVVEFWPWHIKQPFIRRPVPFWLPRQVTANEFYNPDISGTYLTQQSKNVQRLWNLILHKNLAFEVRPWGPNSHFGPLGCKGCPIPSYYDTPQRVPTEQRPRDLPWMPLIHWAAEVGHMPLLSVVHLSLGDYIQHERYHHETLMIACRHGQEEVVVFLHFMFGVQLQNSSNRAIEEAARYCHLGTLRFLLRMHGSEAPFIENMYLLKDGMDLISGPFAAPLLALALRPAIEEGHCDVVNYLVDEGAEIEGCDSKSGMNALHRATKCGHSEMCLLILNLARKHDVKSQEKLELKMLREQDKPDGMTALHYAVISGLSEVLEDILECCELYDSQNSRGETPLMLAAEHNRAEAAEILLRHGASHTFRGGDCPSFSVERELFRLIFGVDDIVKPCAIHIAAAKGHHEVLAVLPCTGGTCTSQLLDQAKVFRYAALSPLSLAVVKGHALSVEVLLEKGANIHSAGYSHSPLQLAAITAHHDVVWVLLKYGANTDSKEVYGMTALHIAASKGDLSIVRTLVSGVLFERGFPNAYVNTPYLNKANLEEADRGGYTALHMAIQKNRTEVVRVLLQAGANVQSFPDVGSALDIAIEIGLPESGDIIQLLKAVGASSSTDEVRRDLDRLHGADCIEDPLHEA